MELRQLRYFVAVARFRSFSRAAEHLHVAQSAVSRQVQSLEEELGVILIARGNKQMRLTEAGALFLSRATGVMSELRSVSEEVLAYADTPKGSLRIGVLPFSGELLMPRVLNEYMKKFPDVRIHLRSGVSTFIGEWLNDDHIDLGIMDTTQVGQNLIAETLVIGRMVIVLPSPQISRRLGIPDKKVYAFRDLSHYPLILTSSGHAQRRLIEHNAAECGFTPRIALEADNIGIITASVQAGVGCTVLTYTAAHNAVKRGEVRIAPLINPAIETNISIVKRRDRPETAAMRSMVNYIKHGIAELSASGELPGEYFKLVERLK
jgi:LysR family transcriptional regulator, nitrogen assimilation regulatory protein